MWVSKSKRPTKYRDQWIIVTYANTRGGGRGEAKAKCKTKTRSHTKIHKTE